MTSAFHFVILFSCVKFSYAVTYISLTDASEISGRKFVKFYIDSYPIIVTGDRPVMELFPEHQIRALNKVLHKVSKQPGEPRGIPPYNWVKFISKDGKVSGIFTYKTINACSLYHRRTENSQLFDHLSMLDLRRSHRERPKDYFLARTMIGSQLKIHSVTTNAFELYKMDIGFSNFTISTGAHSDIRVVPCPSNCSQYAQTGWKDHPSYVFSGTVHDNSWHEKPFVAFMNDKFELLSSKILIDPIYPKKTQKNWLPFWDGCQLLFSKRFGPDHVVGEFTSWKSMDSEAQVVDIAVSPSPSKVTTPFIIRGSAVPVSHPLLKDDYLIGCVHIRGTLKVYRHALYVMSNKHPYDILTYSPLFAFNPYKDIDFVMSIYVRNDGDLELTYGSVDCEPRLAMFPLEQLRILFQEYFK